ncbi:hypothetical protein SAMN04487904_101505 [Actinopolyspora lacussalsi subsp. righensis]|uniref:Uncharacterized protein n=1 Tax=Actinopolyspora righensis TaxID=995060 RepID=A0A1I6XEB5_9ACTN|nr:hypothetical protein SAMN04487904_101505 [Actinopolyspora righensis]
MLVVTRGRLLYWPQGISVRCVAVKPRIVFTRESREPRPVVRPVARRRSSSAAEVRLWMNGPSPRDPGVVPGWHRSVTAVSLRTHRGRNSPSPDSVRFRSGRAARTGDGEKDRKALTPCLAVRTGWHPWVGGFSAADTHDSRALISGIGGSASESRLSSEAGSQRSGNRLYSRNGPRRSSGCHYSETHRPKRCPSCRSPELSRVADCSPSSTGFSGGKYHGRAVKYRRVVVVPTTRRRTISRRRPRLTDGRNSSVRPLITRRGEPGRVERSSPHRIRTPWPVSPAPWPR